MAEPRFDKGDTVVSIVEYFTTGVDTGSHVGYGTQLRVLRRDDRWPEHLADNPKWDYMRVANEFGTKFWCGEADVVSVEEFDVGNEIASFDEWCSLIAENEN